MKLRLINATHPGAGLPPDLPRRAPLRAHEVARDPAFAAFLRGYMDDEATPTLRPVPGIDLDVQGHAGAVRQQASPTP
ncbi:hypothetical protein HBB16_11695 [Pseudonocardia sp. MCCB 268]|nr:hypothetical protein [Pseudonocardia cytotoxica]